MDAEEQMLAKGIIIDFCSLTFLDPSGVSFLRQLQSELNSLDITLYITGCSGKYNYGTIYESKILFSKELNHTVYCNIAATDLMI